MFATCTEDATRRLLTVSTELGHAQLTCRAIEPSAYTSHDGIMAAILRRDALDAENAMVEHIERSQELLRMTIG